MTAAERKLRDLVRAICATEQQDVISAAGSILAALLNGGVALKQIRMYPNFAAEAVKRSMTESKVKGKIRRKQ
jgi:predicted regulator of Ras-like GTPase activity (Roadblock/LC7/MglB family)